MELSDLIVGTDKQVKLQKGDVVFNQGILNTVLLC